MKMYLSSFRLGDCPEKLADLFGANKKIGVVANATEDIQTSKERVVKVYNEIEWLTDLGLLADEIDLREYFGNEQALMERIDNYGGVWVRGGNSINIRRAALYSGFDNIILNKNKDENFVYARYSAGICLLTPDLHGIDLCDNPDFIPAGYKSEIIWEGLGILKYYVAPHYRTPNHPESPYIEKTVDYYITHNMP